MLGVLLQGDHFENRPDWVRFEKMFGGDKNNSLAFCDMSNLQVSSIIVSSWKISMKNLRQQEGASWVPTPFQLQVLLSIALINSVRSSLRHDAPLYAKVAARC